LQLWERIPCFVVLATTRVCLQLCPAADTHGANPSLSLGQALHGATMASMTDASNAVFQPSQKRDTASTNSLLMLAHIWLAPSELACGVYCSVFLHALINAAHGQAHG